VAKALALGARLCGAALPVYRAYAAGGGAAAGAWIDTVLQQLRAAMLLTGTAALDDLARQPVLLGPRLSRWVSAGGRHHLDHDEETHAQRQFHAYPRARR
jgi:isopentenyl diphosphate isomerase/L-lactate dehydrogenase-like FMN-dependent dehydrogenase